MSPYLTLIEVRSTLKDWLPLKHGILLFLIRCFAHDQFDCGPNIDEVHLAHSQYKEGQFFSVVRVLDVSPNGGFIGDSHISSSNSLNANSKSNELKGEWNERTPLNLKPNQVWNYKLQTQMQIG